MRAADIDWEDPAATAAPAPARDDSLPGLLDLSGIVAFLRAEALRIGITAAAVFALFIVGWVLFPAKYTATALVMVDPRSAKTTLLEEVLPGIGGDSVAIASIAEIATADTALVAMVRAEKLADDRDFAGSAAGTPKGESEAIGSLRKAIKVARRGLTYVIEVSATSGDAEKAARLANAVAKQMVDRQSATRIDASASVSGALEGRLADMRAVALASEKAVADYRMSHGLLDVTADSTVGQRRLGSLTQQASTIRGRLEEAKARWEELRRLKPADFGGGSAPRSELLAQLRTQLSDEKRQAADLTRVYGPRHPRVDASQERLSVIEEQIRAETTHLVDQAKTEVDQLTKQNAAIEAELSKRTNAELAMNQDEVVLRDLIRQAEADRQIYEQFRTRQMSTQEQSGLTRPDTEVVSRALPPQKSNKPSIVLVAPAGLLVGLLAGIGVAVLLRRRPGPVAVAEASAALIVDEPTTAVAPVEPVLRPTSAVPVVAHIVDAGDEPVIRPAAPIRAAEPAPRGPTQRRRILRPDPQRIFTDLGIPVVADLPRLFADVPRLGRGDAGGDVDLAVVDARPAMMPFAETFFPHLKTHPGQALMVTTVPGAIGRTTMALAIGRMAEAVGLTALVVTDHGDARLLRPSLAELLDEPADLERRPPSETIDAVSVMSFDGQGNEGFWDLASDHRLPALMERLKQHWDLVVVESQAPTVADQDLLPPADAFRSVLLVADRARNTMAEVAEGARLWGDDHDRLVMVGLNAA